MLGRWPLSPIAVERPQTDEVQFKGISLPLWWGTDVTFRTSGPAAKYIFRPWKADRLRECLLELGWPIVDEPPMTVNSLLRRRT